MAKAELEVEQSTLTTPDAREKQVTLLANDRAAAKRAYDDQHQRQQSFYDGARALKEAAEADRKEHQAAAQAEIDEKALIQADAAYAAEYEIVVKDYKEDAARLRQEAKEEVDRKYADQDDQEVNEVDFGNNAAPADESARAAEVEEHESTSQAKDIEKRLFELQSTEVRYRASIQTTRAQNNNNIVANSLIARAERNRDRAKLVIFRAEAFQRNRASLMAAQPECLRCLTKLTWAVAARCSRSPDLTDDLICPPCQNMDLAIPEVNRENDPDFRPQPKSEERDAEDIFMHKTEAQLKEEVEKMFADTPPPADLDIQQEAASAAVPTPDASYNDDTASTVANVGTQVWGDDRESRNAVWCAYCRMYLNGPTQLEDHLNGKKHQNRLRQHAGPIPAGHLRPRPLAEIHRQEDIRAEQEDAKAREADTRKFFEYMSMYEDHSIESHGDICLNDRVLNNEQHTRKNALHCVRLFLTSVSSSGTLPSEAHDSSLAYSGINVSVLRQARDAAQQQSSSSSSTDPPWMSGPISDQFINEAAPGGSHFLSKLAKPLAEWEETDLSLIHI